MNRNIELFGGPADDHLVHFDQDRMDPMVDAVLDSIHATARALNPDDPDAAEKALCGGCYTSLCLNLIQHAARSGGARKGDRARYLFALGAELMNDAIALCDGDPIKVAAAAGKSFDVRVDADLDGLPS